MFFNHLKTAWRNILRNRVNSILNITGLAIGIASVILIALYVRDEYKFDRFFTQRDRLCQVYIDANFGGQAYVSYGTPPPVGAAMHETFPQVKAYTRTFMLGTQIVSEENGRSDPKHFTEKRLFGADSNYLQLFDYPVRIGDPQTCLNQPHSIVLTQASAVKYFGSAEAAMGKRLTLDQFHLPFTVTAVLRDVPEASSFQFDMLVSMADCRAVKQFNWSWIWCQMSTYVLLDDRTAGSATALGDLQARFPPMVREQAVGAFKRIGQPFDEFLKKGGKWDFHLQPIDKVHLYSSSMGSFYSNGGDITYLYIFSIVALFIIVLACVNFMNLATARAAGRAKEIGVRKVLGSPRGLLMRQFLAEALLYSLLSTIIAVALAGMALPFFNQLSGKSLAFGDLFDPRISGLILLLSVLTGLLAGIYPAFYLASFNPVSVLKGVGFFKGQKGPFTLRNGLVVFQFAVSIALIVCTIIVFRQLSYTRNKDLGFRKENVVLLSGAERIPDGQREALRLELLQVPGVEDASISTDVPGANFYGFTDFYTPTLADAREPLAKDVTLTSFVVDEHFIPTLHMQLLKGRNFSKAFSDSASVIVNEATVKQVGWKNPIGRLITYPGKDDQQFRVIGVVKDFNVQSLRNVITPFALFPEASHTYSAITSYLIVSVHGDLPPILSAFQTKWKSYAPQAPFTYSFLDKDFETLYQTEVRMGGVFLVFTGLSILVACLGLLGLSIYTAERRTKELGIRKVLGASVQSLVLLLTADFLGLVGISALIATPIAWWGMNTWLTGFVYRTTITWWVFAAAGVLALLIAIGTTSFQALKSALANPIKSLRTE